MSELSSIPALTIAIFLGGVVSGFSGFAFSAVAGVILLHLFEPLLAIPLMMCCSIASQMSSLALIRQHIQWRASVPLLIGGAGGVPIALYLLTLTNAHAFRISVGIFLASYAIYMLTKPACGIVRQVASPVVHSMVGFAGALVGGLTAMPGTVPVIWCDLRGVSKEAHLWARHPPSRSSSGSLVGHSRGGGRHACWHFAVGEDRRRQIPLFRPVAAVDLRFGLDPLNRYESTRTSSAVFFIAEPPRHACSDKATRSGGAMPSCSQEFATSHTVARCRSRFQRRSSNSVPWCIVQRSSHITRSCTRQRWV